MKHTKGPWKLSINNGSGRQIMAVIGNGDQQNLAEFKLRGDIPVTIFTDVWVQFPSKEWNEMQDANAELIARAPELLEENESLKNELHECKAGRKISINVLNAEISELKSINKELLEALERFVKFANLINGQNNFKSSMVLQAEAAIKRAKL
jgi:hypothetical protein